MSKVIELRLPQPHEAQRRVIGEAKRFNIVCCGRRFGKTVLGIDRLIYRALQASRSRGSLPITDCCLTFGVNCK